MWPVCAENAVKHQSAYHLLHVRLDQSYLPKTVFWGLLVWGFLQSHSVASQQCQGTEGIFTQLNPFVSFRKCSLAQCLSVCFLYYDIPTQCVGQLMSEARHRRVFLRLAPYPLSQRLNNRTKYDRRYMMQPCFCDLVSAPSRGLCNQVCMSVCGKINLKKLWTDYHEILVG